MKKAYTLIFSLVIISSPVTSFSDEFNLLVKTCKSCSWIIYPQPFRLKEQCEIARQGIFLKGMTKCKRNSAL